MNDKETKPDVTQGNLFDSMTSLPDRYSTEYLKVLSEQLDIDNLIATSDFEERDENEAKHAMRCIEIDFCGHAANTLLGNENISSGRTATTDEANKYLNIARENFKKLFEPKTLEILTTNGIYLKVRFCFAYLYSDFPVCLIKAEDPYNWRQIGEDSKYQFYINPRMTEDELINSSIYKSQRDSLEIIGNIVEKNKTLVMRGTEKHSIQVRFPVIPSPLCLLIINNYAYCDSYLYAMLEGHGANPSFSLHYPISIINKQIHKMQFESVRKHFKYLWRHDLTLFCGDATHFKVESDRQKKDNIAGLQKIKPPYKINWRDKEARIRKYYDEVKTKYGNLEIIESDVKKWRRNLNEKLKLSTTKIVLDKWEMAKHSATSNIKSSVRSWVILMIAAVFTLSLGVLLLPISAQAMFNWIISHAGYTVLASAIFIISIILKRTVEFFIDNK